MLYTVKSDGFDFVELPRVFTFIFKQEPATRRRIVFLSFSFVSNVVIRFDCTQNQSNAMERTAGEF